MAQLESKSWCLSLSHRVKVHSLIDFYGLVDLFMYISMYDFDLSLLKKWSEEVINDEIYYHILKTSSQTHLEA